MRTQQPGVAVIVAAWNAQDTIAAAVRSALAEPEVHEVVLVDDASSDDTVARAYSADDGTGRLRCHTLPANGGPAAARNWGIANTEAPLVAVLDADDRFVPGRLGRLLAGPNDWDMLADDLVFADATPVHSTVPARRSVNAAEFMKRNVPAPKRARGEWGFLKPVIRRDALCALDLRYDERLRLGEDVILYATALLRGARFVIVDQPGTLAAVRPDSLSARHGAGDLRRLRVAARALLPACDPDASRALRRLLVSLDVKIAHRDVLDAKASGGARSVLATLAAQPAASLGVARAVWRDKRGPPAPPTGQRLLSADDFRTALPDG